VLEIEAVDFEIMDLDAVYLEGGAMRAATQFIR